MFDYTVKTSKSIEEAITTLEESLKCEGFGVLWNIPIFYRAFYKDMEIN
ncbi:hypothetical protein ACFOU2_21910 [Bacillus songklensis]|uniref:Uncharacterized protein n=1 Tax=Bacillus songklensis TaxID=1069116 RepID=A0ABV8B6P0_9BACI